MRMDYEKISRVFSNLIDNAVKYRSEDNPTLSVSTMCSDGGVYVNISDNGIGIEGLKTCLRDFIAWTVRGVLREADLDLVLQNRL